MFLLYYIIERKKSLDFFTDVYYYRNMKMIDLDDPIKHLTMAGFQCRRLISCVGDIRYATGEMLNEIDNKKENFEIFLDHNDIFNVKVNNKIISI